MSRFRFVVRRLASAVLLLLLASLTSGCALLVGVTSEMAGGAGPVTPAGSPSARLDGVCAELLVLPGPEGQVTPGSLEAARRVVEARIRTAGLAAASVRAEEADRLVAVLPGVVAGSESDTILRDLVQAPGAVELVPVPAELLGQVANGPLPDGLADVAPLLDGGDVAGVSTSSDDVTGSPVLELTLTESAARAFDDFGAAHLGEQVAIVVDGAIITAPVLNAPRFEGQISITGDFTTDEAARLASILAWPLPLEIREVAWAACG